MILWKKYISIKAFPWKQESNHKFSDILFYQRHHFIVSIIYFERDFPSVFVVMMKKIHSQNTSMDTDIQKQGTNQSIKKNNTISNKNSAEKIFSKSFQ